MSDDSEKDNMRLCPTCRMPISVLATRCRHCGEEVARPRKEEKQLTLKDLGGEQSTTYTVSGNVMDALELFREEQMSSQEVERHQREQASGTWFGRKPAAERPGSGHDRDMPELDANNRDLAGMDSLGDMRSSSTRRTAPRRNLGPTPQQRLVQVGGAVIGLIVLYFAGTWGWERYQTYQADQEAIRNPAYVSSALSMLAAGKPVIDCLQEAVRAVSQTDSPENRDALEQTRARVIEDINKLLNSPAYSREDLDKASMLATRASLEDGDSRLQEMDKLVKAEIAAYSVILMALDVKTQRAKFKLHDASFAKEEQEVGVGDYVAERFVVQSIIEGQVRLIDNKRMSPTGQRSVIARLTSPVSAS